MLSGMSLLGTPIGRQADWRTTVMTRTSYGQPRTLRLVRNPAQQAAYRRLALTILGLDVAHLASQLKRSI